MHSEDFHLLSHPLTPILMPSKALEARKGNEDDKEDHRHFYFFVYLERTILVQKQKPNMTAVETTLRPALDLSVARA